MRLQGLVVRYPAGDFTLGPLDLDGPVDRPWLVVGASGSGKSTLLRVLGGRLAPTAGGIERREDYRDAAYLPQFPERALAGRNLAEDLSGQVRPGGETRSRLRRALEETGLAGVPLSRRSRELSGGERRRVALALVMLTLCKFWALDEPDAALDREGEAHLIEALFRSRRAGTTLWIASHRPEIYRSLDPWLVVLESGQLVGTGDLEWVESNPRAREALSLGSRFSGRLWTEVEHRLGGALHTPNEVEKRARLRAELLEKPGLG